MFLIILFDLHLQAKRVFIPREVDPRLGVLVDITSADFISDVFLKIQKAYSTHGETYAQEEFIFVNINTKRPIKLYRTVFPIDAKTGNSEISFIIGKYVLFQPWFGKQPAKIAHPIPIDYIETVLGIQKRLNPDNPAAIELLLVRIEDGQLKGCRLDPTKQLFSFYIDHLPAETQFWIICKFSLGK